MTADGVFRHKRVVRDEDTDFLGHVNNVVWVSFVVRLAERHARSLGFDWETVKGLGGMWIVRRHEIDYHRSAMPGQELIEETWVAEMRGARSVRGSRFTLAEDGSPLVSAVTQWAFCDPETQRPKRIHRSLIDAYTLVAGP
jgi:acyl-CoA thioester hydrolase